MKATLSRHIIIFNDALSEENKEDIQEFVNIFGEKFKVNWKRDNTFIIRNRHNKKGGANLQVEFKSRHVTEVSPNQLELFEADAVEAEHEVVSNTNGQAKEEPKGKVRHLPASNVQELNS